MFDWMVTLFDYCIVVSSLCLNLVVGLGPAKVSLTLSASLYVDTKPLLVMFDVSYGFWYARVVGSQFQCFVLGLICLSSWGASKFIFWNLQKFVSKQFVIFWNDICIVLKYLGSCCEANNCYAAILKMLLCFFVFVCLF